MVFLLILPKGKSFTWMQIIRALVSHHALLFGLNTAGEGRHLPLELGRGREVAHHLVQRVRRLVAKEHVELALGAIVSGLQAHLHQI